MAEYVCTSKKLQRKLWEKYNDGVTEIKHCGYTFRIKNYDEKYYVERKDKRSGFWITLDELHPTVFNRHNYGWG